MESSTHTTIIDELTLEGKTYSNVSVTVEVETIDITDHLRDNYKKFKPLVRMFIEVLRKGE